MLKIFFSPGFDKLHVSTSSCFDKLMFRQAACFDKLNMTEGCQRELVEGGLVFQMHYSCLDNFTF